MDIKRINEELEKFLLHELKPTTRQKVADEREAQWLAAQATADRLKAKFEKTKKLKDKLNPKTKEEVKDSLISIANELDFIGTDFSNVEVKDGDFIIIINDADLQNGKLTKSAEERLQELLEEMSEKYGCKYSYKVIGNKVEIICEKPKLDKTVWYANFINYPQYEGTIEYGEETFEEANYKITVLEDDYDKVINTETVADCFAYMRDSDGYLYICGNTLESLLNELIYETTIWQDDCKYSEIDFDKYNMSIDKSVQDKIRNRERLTYTETCDVLDAYNCFDYDYYIVKVEEYKG